MDISENIFLDLKKPIYEYEKVFNIAKRINEEIEIESQEYLIDYIQYCWWKETFNREMAYSLERLKNNINNGTNPRLSWEVGLLEIAVNQSTSV